MVTEVLQSEFEALKNELIAKYDELGMRASGNFAESLEVQVNDTKAVLLGANYAEQLEYGRKSGKFPPIAQIEQWINDKGIISKIQGKISVSSLAFLIARKIARVGWKREEFGGVELITQVVTPERIQQILDKVSDIYLGTLTSDIQKVIIKEFAA